MPVRISDPALASDLVEFLRRNAFLAVQDGDDLIDVLPIRPRDDRSDLVRIGRYLDAWLVDHPGVIAEIFED